MHNRRSFLKYISEAEFPVSRDELLTLADCNGASTDILDLLEQLPDVDFESEEDVVAACHMMEELAEETLNRNNE